MAASAFMQLKCAYYEFRYQHWQIGATVPSGPHCIDSGKSLAYAKGVAHGNIIAAARIWGVYVPNDYERGAEHRSTYRLGLDTRLPLVSRPLTYAEQAAAQVAGAAAAQGAGAAAADASARQG
jgi:hypothetical protein